MGSEIVSAISYCASKNRPAILNNKYNDMRHECLFSIYSDNPTTEENLRVGI